MRISKATLIKRSTADGNVDVEPWVKIGTAYEVDLDDVHTITMIRVDSGIVHVHECIAARDGLEWNYIPTELLRIEGWHYAD